MKPLWRRAYSGDVAPGWLRRRAGRDQPRANGSHEDHRPEGQDHEGQAMDRPWPSEPDQEGHRSLMPPRPYVAEDHWTEVDVVPVVPDAWRDPRAGARLAYLRAKHWLGFHLVRTPVYAGRNLLWSPRGLRRDVVGLWRWVTDFENRDVIWAAGKAAEETGDFHQYDRLTKSREARVKPRRLSLAFMALALGGLGYLVLMDLWLLALVAPVLVLVLGYQGRPSDRPYFESSVTSAPEAIRITGEMILVALHRAGLAREADGPEAPTFLAPGVAQEHKGWGATVDLPLGYSAETAIKAKTKIAANLRISGRRLFIEEAEHAGQIKLWIADSDPLARPPVVSPLVKASKFDLWREIPFGQDEKGQQVSFLLLWTFVLIGALPGMGKTFVLRLIVAAAALDPYSKLLLWDGKGGKDHAPFERVCHAFGAGAADEVARALLAATSDLVRDMDGRYAKIAKLPVERVPEGKLTSAASRDRKLNMPVTLLAIDEFQVYLQNKLYGKDILDNLTKIAQRGRGAGIILALATQRPSSTVMKTDFRDLFGTRIALRMPNSDAAKMILGDGGSRTGLDSSTFKATDKGVCILLGADEGALVDRGAVVVKSHLMDLPAATQVANRARALREGAGTLTGVAAGEPEALTDEVLNHAAAAFEGEDQAHSEVLVARMAATYPGLYGTWDQSDLAAALGRFGIAAGNQTWAAPLDDGPKRNRKGFALKQVLDVLVEKAGEVPDSPTGTAD